MFYIATITKWESHRDSKGRVSAIDRPLGRDFLINTDKMVDLVSTGATSCKFKFIENPYDPRAGWDYVEASESVTDIIDGHDLTYSSNFITLPIFERNKTTRHTVDTLVEVSDIVYCDTNNADTTTSWVVYLKEGFKRVEALVDLTLAELYELVVNICNQPFYTFKSGNIWYKREINDTDGYFTLWYSNDGGVTWTELFTLDLAEESVIIDLNHIYVHSIDGTAYVVETIAGDILYST